MAIRDVNQGAISLAAQIPFYDPANGDDRRDSVADLLALLVPTTAVDGFITQYFAPNATGWSVLIAPPTSGENVKLLATPTAGFAAGTITLPAQATCVDGQEVLVACTQAVTTLTVAGNGSTVNGAPTTLAANAFFRLCYDGVLKAWFRIG